MKCATSAREMSSVSRPISPVPKPSAYSPVVGPSVSVGGAYGGPVEPALLEDALLALVLRHRSPEVEREDDVPEEEREALTALAGPENRDADQAAQSGLPHGAHDLSRALRAHRRAAEGRSAERADHGVGALERGEDRDRIKDVPTEHFEPRMGEREAVGVSDQRAHPMAGRERLLGEPKTDAASCAEDGQCLSAREGSGFGKVSVDEVSVRCGLHGGPFVEDR